MSERKVPVRHPSARIAKETIEGIAEAAARLGMVAPAMGRVPRGPDLAMLEAARVWSLAAYGREIGEAAAVGCWLAMFDAAVKR